MAILIDPPAWPAHGTLWSHLISDHDQDELHAFAALLGVPRRGFDLDHYDVPASLHDRAIMLGALPVTAKDVVHRLRRSGLRVRGVEREAMRPVQRRRYLLAEWASLGETLRMGRAGRVPEQWLGLGEELLARWNETHRRYHDERHLEDVLLALNHLSVRGERIMIETQLAAWFHDAIYHGADGGADELDSARLATASLHAVGLDSGLSGAVGRLIVETAPGRSIPDPPAALAHLLDADLSIFAASPTRYAEYASAVREEYAHVPQGDFATGRSRILDTYLAQPTIYRTGTALELWEHRARANLAQEMLVLDQLRSGGSLT